MFTPLTTNPPPLLTDPGGRTVPTSPLSLGLERLGFRMWGNNPSATVRLYIKGANIYPSGLIYL